MDGLVIADAAGRICHVSPSYCQLLGYSREELVGMSIDELRVWTSPQNTAERLEQIMASRVKRFETAHRRKDGAVVELDVNSCVIETETGPLFLGFVRDLTPRFEADRRDAVTRELIRALGVSGSRGRFLRATAALLSDWTRCRHVGIRLLDEDGNLPYAAQVGFDQGFLATEACLCLGADECVCTRVAQGRPASSDAGALTPTGAFAHNDIAAFVDSVPLEDLTRYRGACARAGYRSLAIVPICRGEQMLGVVHLADENPGRIPPTLVEFVESLTPLIAEAVYRFTMEEQLAKDLSTQTVIHELLRLSLENASLQQILDRALELTLSIPWLASQNRGAVLLIEGDPKALVMKCQNGLAEPIVQGCARLPLGRCLCGRAAVTGEIEYASDVDDRHEATYEGMTPHGHYCVPIKSATEVLGILNVYTEPGHRRASAEERFLTAVANTLAGMIAHRQTQEARGALQQRYSELIEGMDAIVWEADPSTWAMTFVSRRAEEMLGYPVEEWLADPHFWANHIHPDDRDRAVSYCAQATAELRNHQFDYRMIKADGTAIWVRDTVTVEAQGGKPVRLKGFISDISEAKRAEEGLRQALEATAVSLAAAAEMRDPYTAGHQLKVARLAVAISRELGLREEAIEVIRLGGTLHDIGKLRVPADLLTFPGRLSPVELEVVKTHVQASYDILKDIPFGGRVADIVLQHHERLNGSGYPLGLSGDQILPGARILAVADVTEAMASHRPYRAALGVEAALAHITENAGVLYDPDAVQICVRLFNEQGFSLDPSA